jgi:hypothetical protein
MTNKLALKNKTFYFLEKFLDNKNERFSVYGVLQLNWFNKLRF